jgi:beta-galactosidase
LREHGGRRQFNYASPRYRLLCQRVVAQLAARFGHNPNVIGWQIGNEYTDESFDPATRVQFQQFLKDKYKTLDNLNQHWTTPYWSQTYSDWSQIPMVNSDGNPGLLLEHKHFVTQTWRSFQQVQLDTLRRVILPTQFITTNIGGLGWSDNWDHYRICDDLDIASWDDYVGQGHLNAVRNGFLNDFARGWKRRNFWVMETQPGFVNWAPISTTLSRGETSALVWQAVGHGADAVLFWQWRSALNGQEQYHGTLVGPDGSPLPLYDEVKQLGADLIAASTALAGTSPLSSVAILSTYDSRWAIDFQMHTREYDQLGVLLSFYKPLEELTHSIDIVQATAPLDSYKLVVAPSLNVIDKSLAEHLLAYVRNGGHLILGPRSGMKDEYIALNLQRQPGPLAEALGGGVEQYYALDTPVPVDGGSASIWAEQLSATEPDTHVDLRYGKSNGWLDNQPAAITRTVGKGTISYLGTIPDAALMQTLLSDRAASAGVTSFFGTLPPDVELCRRVALERTVYILINHGKIAEQVVLPGPMHELLSKKSLSDITLAPQSVAIFTTGVVQ